jgi:D-alanyl-D-alanine dipeptidase
MLVTANPVHAANTVLPEGFVYLDEAVADLRVDLAYAGAENFVGAVVDGYEGTRAILSAPAAKALSAVQDELRPFGLGLKVFDAYRPQRAVAHFVRWAETPDDPDIKALYYPDIDKHRLFEEGYVATRSSHSRGSTVDLTVASLADGTELDMGTRFDFFGPESWPDHEPLTDEQRANRLLLRLAMERHGFKPFDKEWWHFTLKDEPFPETYFDFPVR